VALAKVQTPASPFVVSLPPGKIFEPIRTYCTVRACLSFVSRQASVQPLSIRFFFYSTRRVSRSAAAHTATLGFYDTRRVEPEPEWKRNPTSAAFASDALLPIQSRLPRRRRKVRFCPLLRARCYANACPVVASRAGAKLILCFLRGATRRRLRVLLVRPRHAPETVTPCAHVGPASQKFQRL
jgi:hypothetical protein